MHLLYLKIFYLFLQGKIQNNTFQKNSILITGAAGFIGSAVCKRLLMRGENVLGIDKGLAEAASNPSKERILSYCRELWQLLPNPKGSSRDDILGN